MIRIALLTTTLALGGCNAMVGSPPAAETPPVVQSQVEIATSSIPELDCRPAGPSGGITC